MKTTKIDNIPTPPTLKTLFRSRFSDSIKTLEEEYNSDILKSEQDIINKKLYSHQDIKQKVALWKKR